MIFEYKAETTAKPFLNENSWMMGESARGTYNTQPFNYKEFMALIKKTPEAIGILRAMTTDILSDGVVWKGGKNKIAKAKAWCSKRQVWTKKLPEGLLDWLGFGNNLIWPGISKPQVKEMVMEESKMVLMELKETKQMEISEQVVDEISVDYLDYRNVPWSTVSIESDATDVTGFSQNMGTEPSTMGQERRWRAEDVIHASLMSMDGKAYGYSPMVASTCILSTLALIKDYNGYKFENGGEPDLIFSFPQEIANNPNVMALVKHLTEKRNSKNKGGHLVMTGEVKIQPVSDHNKDMEYRLLAIYYTGILAFAFNMPIGRIQSILGSEIKLGSSDLSDSGYWRSISHMQAYWEETLNTRIFMPFFGVSFKFKRSYKQDEVREASSKMMNIQWMTNLMSGMKIKPSKNYIKEVLAVDDDDFDWSSFDKLDLNALPQPKGDGNQMSDGELNNSDAKNSADNKKREVMNSRTNVA